ncbi:GNAT family N-acetyltransferase [Pararhizobium sp. LjRoot238]|uniref:GNAT family N-acetyltransferase n=1 Tax=Pararhizobium sp. LjRoot238 TaxID=3342293 RepID=UPI003F509FEF
MGYSPVPPGKIVNAVTFLEMREQPEKAAIADGSLTLVRLTSLDLEDYRRLFRLVGEDWMWVSRLEMDDDAVRAILSDPSVEVYALQDGARHIGLLELDFRAPGECELVFFGLVRDAIGKGAGRFLMNNAIAKAWTRPIDRFWLHTCNFDHPDAFAFYQRSGFRPYALMVEVHDDPRLTGLLPKTAAPHVPLLDIPRCGV